MPSGEVLDFYYLTAQGVQDLFDQEITLKSPTQTMWFLPLSAQKVIRQRIAILQGHRTMGVLITDRVAPDNVSAIDELNRLVVFILFYKIDLIR